MKRFFMPAIGGLVGLIALALVYFGNPPNMGICVACFLRDTAGALGLHGAGVVQYLRPEIVGILLGVLILSLIRGEFSARGGSAPFTRFILGFALMVGALIFLGCPLRMVLRIAGGDLNGLVGLLGFVTGILCGVFFLKKGYALQRTSETARSDGYLLPIVVVVLLGLMLVVPTIFKSSATGPGSMHAPLWIALGAGLVIGAIGFFSRLCFVGSIRDAVLFKKFYMLSAIISLIVVVAAGNIILGKFQLGFAEQPIAHNNHLWNFLGLSMVGLCSVLLGGCPFRQLILAGSGNSDSGITIVGMIAGGAMAHNFGMASSAAGVTQNGKIGFAVMAVVVLFIAAYNTFGRKK